MTIDWQKLQGRTTFILGGQKHAGKTTFMTYALRNLRSGAASMAYMSTGIDGEGRDAISGQAKPVVLAEVGDVVATTEAALNAGDCSFEVLHVFEECTVMGRPVVAAIRRAGRLELIGPGSNRRLGEVIRWIRDHTPARTLLVDGAADRITQAAATGQAGIVMVMQVTPATLTRSVDRIRLLLMLAQLPPASAATGDVLHLPGAVTATAISNLPTTCQSLAFDDFTKIFLSYADMQKLTHRYQLYITDPCELLWIVVNLQDVAWATLAESFDEASRACLVVNPFMEPQPC